jgi:hypothetical protein
MNTTSRLDAVNRIMESIGESPVQTLNGEVPADVLKANATLDEVARDIQSIGWSWNTDLDYQLVRNGDNEIVLPANALTWEFYPWDTDYVIRGGKLYDRVKHTFTFTADLKLHRLVSLLTFEDMPEAVKQCIIVKAARLFSSRLLTAESVSIYTQQDEVFAWVRARNDELRVTNANVKNSPTVQNITRRYGCR